MAYYFWASFGLLSIFHHVLAGERNGWVTWTRVLVSKEDCKPGPGASAHTPYICAQEDEDTPTQVSVAASCTADPELETSSCQGLPLQEVLHTRVVSISKFSSHHDHLTEQLKTGRFCSGSWSQKLQRRTSGWMEFVVMTNCLPHQQTGNQENRNTEWGKIEL